MVPPGPVELPGVDRLSCGPAFQQTVRTASVYYDIERGCRSAELTCPLYAATLSDPRGSDGSRPRRAVARRLSYNRTQGRMGARVMASGMPGASRRAVLGGATYSVVKVHCTVFRGAGRPRQRHNQRHIPTARVQRGGVNPRHCARGFRVTVPFGKRIICDKGQAEARARGSIAHGMFKGILNCDSCESWICRMIWRWNKRDTRGVEAEWLA